ncbi:FixH family protein [Thiocystis violacea]|uniref:FixH family protein n=1 Tax=Thiocystis violacea TaxID=13725 RepID=UPI00190682D5|nr:FixH family protein [Thiocystis violacea]MBK1721355.1 nitrogen fixation protein FixH [Thiocystis violacea]
MTTETHPSPSSAFRSPWVLGWLGLVVTVLAINGVMVYLAFATNPGLVNADYYERGQHFERNLMSRQARAPAWTVEADIPASLMVDTPAWIRVFLVDKAGQPVDPDAVTLYVYRPSDAGRDFSIPMTREDSGRYVAKASFPLIGVWDTLIAVQSDEDEYSIGERVNVGAY